MHANSNDLIAHYPQFCQINKVAIENKKRFEIQSNEEFVKIHVDGHLIDDITIRKCDFVFIRSSNEEFYFVELKGKKIEDAYEQICTTISYFQNNLVRIPANNIFGFIVTSAGIPKCQQRINLLKQKFRRSNFGKELEIKNNMILFRPK